VPGLFGSSVKTEFEIKKSGSLVIPGKVLEAQGYKAGAKFKIEFGDKGITRMLLIRFALHFNSLMNTSTSP
jgi:hypothetical protein